MVKYVIEKLDNLKPFYRELRRMGNLPMLKTFDDTKEEDMLALLNKDSREFEENPAKMTTQGILQGVEKSTAREVYGAEKLADSSSADREVIVLLIEVDEYDKLLRQPMTRSDFPGGKYRMFLEKYKKISLGMEVDLKRDERGFWKLDLA